MPVTFYFAIGREYRKADLDIALAVGQRHFLVPAGSLAARRLREVPGIHVALDSEAFPPGNPLRITLLGYWSEVLSWRREPGDWGCLDWFASYDTIGDAAKTLQDEQELRKLIERDAPDAPLVKVVGFGMPIEETVAAILASPLDDETRPSYGVGGLAVERYSAEANAWYSALLDELERADDEQFAGIKLHLFGIGKNSWVLRSTRGLITSFDSSGPGRMAGIAGPQRIATRYTPTYGISIEKLQLSREARLAYYLASWRRSVGLSWNQLDGRMFIDDPTPPLGIQHALDLDDGLETESEQPRAAATTSTIKAAAVGLAPSPQHGQAAHSNGHRLCTNDL